MNAAKACTGKTKISAVGIDAPLFWVPAGDRNADQIVRRAITRLGSHGGTVSSVNSLRGACLIQGMLVAIRCRQEKEGIPITEAHPKALLWLLGKATPELHPVNIALVDLYEYVVGCAVKGATDHERDAVLGAVTAFAMMSRLTGWHDIHALETTSVTPLKPPPGYWMPLPSELDLDRSN